jgi:septal ring factor EnvC (AmiA/AmiB activator)
MALVCALSATSYAQQTAPGGPDIDAARAAVGKWQGTQQIIFKERKQWQQDKQTLTDRIDLVQREIADLRARLTETRGKVSEQRAKRAETTAKIDQAKTTASQLAERVAGYEAEVRKLHPLLPPHVQEKVAPLFKRMPEAGREVRISAAERYQNVLGILTELNKANSEVALVTEIRALSDGRPSEVQTVYFGLAQAYFMSAQGEAGVGKPGVDGWVWQPANDRVEAIHQVIDILENKGVPKFIALPVSLQ